MIFHCSVYQLYGVKALNQTFNELRLEKHPDKTVMGRTEKGFDFLGYHFSPEGLSLAEKTIENFVSCAVRLYEQEREEPSGSPLLGLYVKRWVRRVRGNYRISYPPLMG